jgi:hypothetical protein
MSAGADFVCIDMCNGWLSIDKVADLLAVRSGAPLEPAKTSPGSCSTLEQTDSSSPTSRPRSPRARGQKRACSRPKEAEVWAAQDARASGG